MKKLLFLVLVLIPSIAYAEGYFYHYDHLGGVDGITNWDGEIVVDYDYYPFGDTAEEEVYDDIFLNSYQYTGQESDDEIDLYYYDARYYDAMSGRFMSQDPAVYDERIFEMLGNPQMFNSYTYVLNNPVKYVDPSGEYVVDTGEIESGDTKESITNEVNDALGINATWEDIANVSFIDPETAIDDLVGEYTNVGTDYVADITDYLNELNNERAQEAISEGYGWAYLSWLFRRNGAWDMKNSDDEILGGGASNRKYWAYILDGSLLRYDAPGNINFGYVWNAAGYGVHSAIRGGAIEALGRDDPHDTNMIINGYVRYNYYN